MIFSYWHSAEHEPICEGLHVWREQFPDFRVIGDPDIEPVIARLFPRYLEAYRKIRIPTCKSNLARLLALREWGGLYVDCHCGIRDADSVRQLLKDLNNYELIAFDKHRMSANWHVTNSFMFGQKGSEIIAECTRSAFQNLGKHWQVEKQQGFSPYNIWLMTGTGNLADTIIDWDVDPPALEARFAPKIFLIPEESAPIVRYLHYSYRNPGMHWSERQKYEVLFD